MNSVLDILLYRNGHSTADARNLDQTIEYSVSFIVQSKFLPSQE